jgi:hypothetical protein
MFDRLVEDFCQFDEFCQVFRPHWEALLLGQGAQPARKRGPQAGLAESEIMTILGLYHSSQFSNFKTFYEGGRSHSAARGRSQSPLLCALHRVDPPCLGALDGVSPHPDGTKDGPL